MSELEIKNLSVDLGGKRVLNRVDLRVGAGRMLAVLGPSGVGKTTLLRTLAGFIRPAAGDILLDGRSVLGQKPEKRDLVMVFQRPLLFPFLNVEQNIGFGLRVRRLDRARIKSRVGRMIELMGLAGLEKRRPHELSSGQKQRVSLGRALVTEPGVLLMDEPLANLDEGLRAGMREHIRRVQEATGVTTILVTHDQAEALMIAHQVALILDGRLAQAADPRAIFYHPRTREVARFFGGVNFWEAERTNGRWRSALGAHSLPGLGPGRRRATLTIRPEDLELTTHGEDLALARVVRTRFEGGRTRVWLESEELNLVALTQHAGLEPGQLVGLRAPEERVWPLPEEQEEET